MKHYSNTHSGTKHLELDFIPFILSDIKILLFKHIAPSILLPLFFSLALYTHGAHIFCAPRLIKKHGRIKRRVGKKKELVTITMYVPQMHLNQLQANYDNQIDLDKIKKICKIFISQIVV